MKTGAQIYRGEVVHKRIHPVEHKLNYKVFSLLMDVDKLEETASGLKLFSLNRFNLFSMKPRHHGYRDDRSLSEFAWDQVEKAGLSDTVKRITVLFYPRIWGFAFNPLTVYFCVDEVGEPHLMIYEVRNTFGEDLTYILPAGPNHAGTYTHKTDKRFYVSPFNQVEGSYTFHVSNQDDDLTVGVALRTTEGPILRTHFRGHTSDMTDKGLIKVFLTYPLMTLKIVGGIHWEALKLWRKGMKLQTRPEAPEPRILFCGEDGVS